MPGAAAKWLWGWTNWLEGLSFGATPEARRYRLTPVNQSYGATPVNQRYGLTPVNQSYRATPVARRYGADPVM